MRKALTLSLALIATLALFAAFVPLASAHNAGPCNDTDGDGSPSGQEYAEHHIKPLATTGNLGEGGHIPGSHHGFSACNPSGK